MDKPLQVAIAIGLDPAITIAAGARYDGDELCIAGAIRATGVKVCRGVTVDVDIPAEAEIVIEGYLAPHERRGEGRAGGVPRLLRRDLGEPGVPRHRDLLARRSDLPDHHPGLERARLRGQRAAARAAAAELRPPRQQERHRPAHPALFQRVQRDRRDQQDQPRRAEERGAGRDDRARQHQVGASWSIPMWTSTTRPMCCGR